MNDLLYLGIILGIINIGMVIHLFIHRYKANTRFKCKVKAIEVILDGENPKEYKSQLIDMLDDLKHDLVSYSNLSKSLNLLYRINNL